MEDVLEVVDAEGVETAAPETEDEKEQEDTPNSGTIFLFHTSHVLLTAIVASGVVRVSLVHSDRVVRHRVRSCHSLRVYNWLLLHWLVAHLLLHAWLLPLHHWLLLLLRLPHNKVLSSLTFVHFPIIYRYNYYNRKAE